MKNNKNNSLVKSVVFAAVIISLSLVYLGAQLGSGTQKEFTADDFDKFAQNYAERQEAQQADIQEAQQAQKDAQAKNVEPISDKDHVFGDKDANITIFEYSDFECPFCKRFYETPAQVVADSGGKVNTVFRHFPLSFHDPLATKQAIASECAAELGGTEMFYKYHDEIFVRTKSNGKGMEEQELTKIASDLNLNMNKFKSCLDSEKYLQKVKNDIASGTNAGVTGTPGVIIKNNITGDVRVMPGAVPIEMVEAAVEELSR